MLEKSVNSRRSGPRNNVYDFLRDLISEVKGINESLIKEKEQSNLPDKTKSGNSFKQLKGAIKRIFERGEK